MGVARVQGDLPKKSVSDRYNLLEILDYFEDEFFVIDLNYRIKFANTSLLNNRALKSKTILGHVCYHVLEGRNMPCASPLWDCPLLHVLKTGKPSLIIYATFPSTSDNTLSRYIRVNIYPLKDAHGNIQYFIESRRDVSTERQMEHEIIKRHQHLNALSRISAATSGLTDLKAILNTCLDIVLESLNGELGGILLLDEKEDSLHYYVWRGLLSQSIENLSFRKHQGLAGTVLATGKPVLYEDISREQKSLYQDFINHEGLRGFICAPINSKDKVVGVINIASRMPGKFTQDDLYLLNSIGCQIGAAIEQAKLYRKLAVAAERYQVLLRHALTAQENERKRIARELHDETSQALTSLTLQLQAIIQKVEMGIEDPTDLLERLRAAHKHTVYATAEIVKLMKELRPTLLDELGLQAAIQRYAKDNLVAHGINVQTDIESTTRRLPPTIEVTLFRVAQGLLGNILEHSAAKNAKIKLTYDEQKCIMIIEDDGIGFDVDKLTKVEPGGRGAGLFTIKERIKLVGGNCKIDSKPGHGTKVTINIPLESDGKL